MSPSIRFFRTSCPRCVEKDGGDWFIWSPYGFVVCRDGRLPKTNFCTEHGVKLDVVEMVER